MQHSYEILRQNTRFPGRFLLCSLLWVPSLSGSCRFGCCCIFWLHWVLAVVRRFLLLQSMGSGVCRLSSSCILMAMFEAPGDYNLKSWNISTISHSQGWVVALGFFTQNLSPTLHFLWSKKWQPTAVFSPGKSHGQRSLGGYSPWGCKESGTPCLNHS